MSCVWLCNYTFCCEWRTQKVTAEWARIGVFWMNDCCGSLFITVSHTHWKWLKNIYLYDGVHVAEWLKNLKCSTLCLWQGLCFLATGRSISPDSCRNSPPSCPTTTWASTFTPVPRCATRYAQKHESSLCQFMTPPNGSLTSSSCYTVMTGQNM